MAFLSSKKCAADSSNGAGLLFDAHAVKRDSANIPAPNANEYFIATTLNKLVIITS
ncbi:hypothetical protein l11_11080 [Neisseria weaveri LMG 5135]|nr:hypothetical protein l11_11080 [Neisseria weaveri LMG 5135]